MSSWAKQRVKEDERRSEPCEVRCGCGRLIARLVPGGVELKCGRCRHVTVVPLVSEADDERRGGAR